MFISRRDVTSNRLIILLYIVLLAGIGIGAGALLLDARAEYDKLKQDQAAAEAKLTAAKLRLQEQQRILERLKSDPVFVEKVIRRQLGYARPEQYIFDFDPGR